MAQVASHAAAPARVVLNLPMDPLPAELAAMFGDRFDAVAELWYDDEGTAQVSLARLAADPELGAAAARAIDRGASHAWLAEVVPQIPPPTQCLRFVVAGQMADGMTLAEAQEYWRLEHPRVFRTVTDFVPYIVGYTQMHGRDVLESGAIDWLGAHDFYPMCAEMGLRSVADVVTAYSMPSYLAVIRPDEEYFSKPGEMLSFASGEARTWPATG
ncbi:EthD domain-containing protein [Novosphingobium sp.]|uniref:EthD domain-containing protein n=1 Tax=Novosphingobium sp. TaxID=1874826 RepID=UPI00352A166E